MMNDSSLGMVRQHQSGRTISSEFVQTDHSQMARAFGAHCVQVDSPSDLADAIREAQDRRAPGLIDVFIDRDQPMGSIALPRLKY